MKIHLITIGQQMPHWVNDAVTEYNKRLPKNFLQLIALPMPKRTKNSDLKKLVEKEGELLCNAIVKPGKVIVLDVQGQTWSTVDLANQLIKWQNHYQHINLLIGGPDGLAPQCYSSADEQWSLSSLTLPHPLVRILIVEQLYRAWSINQKHPYHR